VVSPDRNSPAVVGAWRPTIVLPDRLEAVGAENELDLGLAHELEHIARGDLAVSYLSLVAGAIWGGIPGTTWVVAQLRRDLEFLIDQSCARQRGWNPTTYAHGLLLAAQRAWHRDRQPFPSTGAGLPDRVELLLGQGLEPNVSRISKLAAWALALSLLLTLGRLTGQAILP
jgi:hypothetical protein